MNYEEARAQYNVSLDNYERASELFDKENKLGDNCSIIDIMEHHDKRVAFLKSFSNDLRKFYIKLIELTPEEEFILEDIPSYGDYYSFDSFKVSCNDGMLIDYDGFGRICFNKKMTQFEIKPNMVKKVDCSSYSRFDGVVWFNR